MDERKLIILVNDRVKMSRGKYAAQAVHAALLALGVHPEVPVIVLGGRPSEIAGMRTTVRDAGRTEVEPGTLTAGTDWEIEVPELLVVEDRNEHCVERWPGCFVGGYDPRCCRFPKSCSCWKD